MKKIISIALVIIWMIIIFTFSHQAAASSTKSSTSVTKTVVKLVYKDKDENFIKEKISQFETPIRKIAHMFIYFILSLLTYHMLKQFNLSEIKIIILTLIICILYSITDEIHQYFIPGRSNEILDVLIDTIGISIGLLLSLVYNRKRQRKEEGLL